MTAPLISTEQVEYADELRRWREMRGMTKAALAERMYCTPSRISHVEAARQRPNEDFTRRAEEVLQTGGALWTRWDAIAGHRDTTAARHPERDLRTIEFVSWLADHGPYSFAEVYGTVCSAVARLESEPHSVRHGRGHNRRQVTRAQVADAVRHYYGQDGLVAATVGQTALQLTILARHRWLDPVAIGGPSERFRFRPPTAMAPTQIDEVTARAGIERLAAAEVNETVMVNNPLYRLLEVAPGAGRIDATVTTVDFAEYALTFDLLGDELVDAVAAGPGPLAFPLRDTLMPDRAAATDFTGRTCVGGLGALVAIARAARTGGESDYVVFTQERSGRVLNLPGALAVLPKAFHQPVAEAADEVAISMTLRRELEEELLGREDLELLTTGGRHHVDPMHERHTTEPLAWLLDRPDTFRTECTGFGLNLVTGNYDFPCLVVIDDDQWWAQFGHTIEMNWETQHVHRFSTLDTDGLAELATDRRWSNEGLFGLLLGLRRLAEVGDPERLALPHIDLEVL